MAKKKRKINREKFQLSRFVDPLHVKVLVGVVIFMSLLSVSLVVITQIREQKRVEEEQEQIRAFQEGLSQVFSTLTLTDFIFPEQYGGELPQIYLQREPKNQWSREEVDRYWIPIEETGLEDLTEVNRQWISQSLENP